MSDKRPMKKYYLDTGVKLTTLLSINTATTAKITIDDASEIEKVTLADMTKEANKVYTYIYQSVTSDNEGDYVATVTVTYGGYTSVTQEKFTLVKQE